MFVSFLPFVIGTGTIFTHFKFSLNLNLPAPVHFNRLQRDRKHCTLFLTFLSKSSFMNCQSQRCRSTRHFFITRGNPWLDSSDGILPGEQRGFCAMRIWPVGRVDFNKKLFKSTFRAENYASLFYLLPKLLHFEISNIRDNKILQPMGRALMVHESLSAQNYLKYK